MSAALGLGVAVGDAVVSLGASGSVMAVHHGALADPSGPITSFADATGMHLPVVHTLNAVRALRGTAELLGTEDLAALSALALKSTPGASGLVFLPYLEGERTPQLPHTAGTLTGLRRESMKPEHLARAAFEGMLCSLADAMDVLRRRGVEVRRAVLLGATAALPAVQAAAPAIFGAQVVIRSRRTTRRSGRSARPPGRSASPGGRSPRTPRRSGRALRRRSSNRARTPRSGPRYGISTRRRGSSSTRGLSDSLAAGRPKAALDRVLDPSLAQTRAVRRAECRKMASDPRTCRPPRETPRVLRLLRTRLAPYKRPIVLLVALQLFQTVATLYLPTLNADIIDNGVVKGDSGYILEFGAVMIGVSVVQVICNVGAVFFGARTASALGRDVRAAVFARVQSFSAREVGQFGAPSLITRTTNDVQQVQMLTLLSFTLMVSAPIICVGGIIMALGQDIPLSSILLAVVPVLGISVSLIVRRMRPLFRTMQEKLDGVNRVLREQITGNRVIRAFVRDDYEKERFREANTELAQLQLSTGRLMSLMFPTVMTVVNLSSIAVVWFGAHRIDSGAIQIGALTAFLSYLLQIVMAVMMATFMFMMVPRAEVCAERIVEVLDTRSSVVPPQSPVRELRRHGHLEVRQVEFRFPGAEEPVLQDVSLVARPGETTAVIGSTGSGKSTLLSLIPRLMDTTAGEVLVDGQDVRELDLALLAKTVSLVPQKPYLFSGTVATNLRYGNPEATGRGIVERAGGRPGEGLRQCAGGRAERADRPGRHQCLRRPAAAPRDRADAGAAPGDLSVRRLVLGAGLRDGRGAAPCAGPGDREGDGGDRRPAGGDHPGRGPDHRPR